MLFKTVHLQGILSGEVRLAFRRWRKPTVKAGTLLHTAIGLVAIQDINTVAETDITDADAVDAGFKSREALLQSLHGKGGGDIYRIAVAFHSEDPRIGLREQTALTPEQLAELLHKLQRLDRHSKEGPWTHKVLTAIQQHPHLHAIGLAERTGYPKEWLKTNIRKLKNLGLTISHTIGYELSPKGAVVLERWTG